MREFILLALKAPTDERFSLKHKTEAGLVCRTISNTLHISKGIRQGTILHVVFNGPPTPPRLITFEGAKIEQLSYDEAGVAKLLKEVLEAGKKLEMDQIIEVKPGITIAKKSFEALLKEKALSTQLLLMDKKGEDLRQAKLEKDVTFILGDVFGLPHKTEKLCRRTAHQMISISPTMLFASHCPVIIHNELDRREKR